MAALLLPVRSTDDQKGVYLRWYASRRKSEVSERRRELAPACCEPAKDSARTPSAAARAFTNHMVRKPHHHILRAHPIVSSHVDCFVTVRPTNIPIADAHLHL
jgi:hypothetical protein